jgi:hypothetical protein
MGGASGSGQQGNRGSGSRLHCSKFPVARENRHQPCSVSYCTGIPMSRKVSPSRSLPKALELSVCMIVPIAVTRKAGNEATNRQKMPII